LAAALIYRSATLYELAMIALYGRHYPARYRAIAAWIPAGSSVLDLCCGPGVLFDRYLRGKGVEYTGLDLNPRFAARVSRRGGRGRVWDLRADAPLPRADVVVMQASLYHFLPDVAPILGRMRVAARTRVIIAEPIRNLAGSRHAWLAALAARQTDAGRGGQPHRFDEPSLDALLGPLATPTGRSFLIPGGREKVYVLEAAGDRERTEG
jgi:SAM-dependent methyltransferase